MNMRVLPPRLQPDDLLTLPDGDHYELVDGIPQEKPMGAESDSIALRLGILLGNLVWAQNLGRLFGSQTGYQCFPAEPTRIRLPDLSFVAKGRLANDRPPKGYIKLVPDLAVEVVSPNELYEELQVKVADYKSAKVRLIWVVSPATKTVLIRRADGRCAELDDTGELSGEDVIPGFTCKVAELFV